MNNPTNEGRTLEVANAQWHVLEEHLLRDGLLVLDQSLEVRVAAQEIADDNTEVVQKWIDEGLIAKPSAEQIKAWEKDRLKEFTCAIVQPFVLIQEVEANDSGQ